MAYNDDEISGVGGWLMFFVLTLGVFTPLAILYLLFGNLYSAGLSARLGSIPGWPAYRLAETIVCVLHIAACAFLTWRLCMVRNWNSVRLTIAGIWAMGLGITLIDLLLTVFLLGGAFGAVFAAEMIAIGRGAIYATLWTAYLLRSERVANTYPRYGDEDQLAAVFD
jgi:hypothetical protein